MSDFDGSDAFDKLLDKLDDLYRELNQEKEANRNYQIAIKRLDGKCSMLQAKIDKYEIAELDKEKEPCTP